MYTTKSKKQARGDDSSNRTSCRKLILFFGGYGLLAFLLLREFQFGNPRMLVGTEPSFDQKNPIFVLSLPSSGNLALNRYFQCSGLDVGRHWTRQGELLRDRDKRVKIGQCMSQNVAISSGRDILDNCGNYSVWLEMDHFTKSQPTSASTRECFLPALRRGIIDQLLEAYPSSTIINAIKEPVEWYQTLSPRFKLDWPEACNGTHESTFPPSDGGEAEWVHFYNQYHRHLQETVSHYPDATYLEIDLSSEDPYKVGKELQQELGISSTCWTEKGVGQHLPKDITYPVFVASLPKSATTTSHEYLRCGLGDGEGHHYKTNYESTGNDLKIATCFYENIQDNKPLTEGCGDYLHWSDIGAIHAQFRPKHVCYYPTLDGGLEEMYKAHPHGTIFHTVRDSTRWYKSAVNYLNTANLWTEYCTDSGFPGNVSDVSAWIDFYHNHTHHVREFARNHPTMNYVEVKLEEEEHLRETLQDNFGFSNSCWGHSNTNKVKTAN